MMAYNFIPYGQLVKGDYGINVDPVTKTPMVSAIEILQGLPTVSDITNFAGRMVHDTVTGNLYMFHIKPASAWVQLNKSTNVTIQATGVTPSFNPMPLSGSMIYDTISGILYLWNNQSWVTVGGQHTTTVIRDLHTGNGIDVKFAISANDIISENRIFVDIDGISQKPLIDYVLSGASITFTTVPASGVQIQIRTFERLQMSSSATFENRVVVNTATYSVSSSDSYIGVTYSTTGATTIDLSNLTSIGAVLSGRKLTIKDEGGNALNNNITIIGGTSTIDGSSTYNMTTNYASIGLVFDGVNWFIT